MDMMLSNEGRTGKAVHQKTLPHSRPGSAEAFPEGTPGPCTFQPSLARRGTEAQSHLGVGIPSVAVSSLPRPPAFLDLPLCQAQKG